MDRLRSLGVLVLLAACRPGAVTSAPPGSSELVAAEPALAEAEPAEVEAAPEPEPALDAPTAELDPTPSLEPPEPMSQPTPPVAAPSMVSTAEVWRESKSGGPPWSRVEVSGASFGVRPTAGEMVTVLPQHPTLPPLELQIKKVVTHGNPREDIPRWWEPVLEKVTERAYFDVATPHGHDPRMPATVVVVYPATPSATLLDPARVSPDDLPPGVLPNSVELAIDVDDDGRPDTIENSVCTENPKRARCFEATTWEIHRREGDGWQLVHRYEPAT